ncbi:MAG: hypothetical protein COB67_10390 [SAR324 cluster bacterium]|uniref:Uncharacterized protein n=1 Tax=SAR324 cluster bacterium TaxID=2024889 RepID=A0A2A4SYU1_9DELT|nr:MAG: hypothetical protein COB67_10390 [SAR324 cluster bacterium]
MSFDLVRLGLYWNTIRYLKLIQVYRRAWFKLYRPKIKSGLQSVTPAPVTGSWIEPPVAGGSWKHEGKQLYFQALNQKSLYKTEGFWRDSDVAYLQLYHRHYFDQMKSGKADKTEDWKSILEKWEKANPIGSKPGWEPYPSSLRITNWVSYHLLTGGLSDVLIRSLAEQIRFLQKQLEFHLQGNHLLVNAKASIFGGCFFQGKEAQKWLKLGLKLTEKEMNEQILPDGMNYELSPMYHAIILVDVLDLINLAYVFPEKIPAAFVSFLKEKARKMLHALQMLSHPKGEIALFGDSAFDVIPPLSEIEQYAQDVGLEVPSTLKDVEVLENAGYVRLNKDKAVLIVKAGNLGPDHLLAHAHADTTSFELSVDGNRLVVDTGVDRYRNDQERSRQRGTPAHNTVTVDQLDSSEMWSSFRVARRARPLPLEVTKQDEHLHLRCGHRGYQRLKDPVSFEREFFLYQDRLEIIDTLSAKQQHHYSWNLYSKQPLQLTVQGKTLEPQQCIIHENFEEQIQGFRYNLDLQANSEVIRSCIAW